MVSNLWTPEKLYVVVRMQEYYFEDPYAKELETKVIDADDEAVCLEKIIIYPGGGGQPFDYGSIAGTPTKGAFERDGKVWFKLGENHGLSAGDTVTTSIDWERRHTLMRIHSAAHVYLSVFDREYPGVEKIGGNIDLERSRLEFNLDDFSREDAERLAEKANALIANGGELASWMEDDGTRITKIGDFEEMPCGGTHVADIKEIGKIVILGREKKGAGRVRIYYTVED